jgi:hypothetical protein
MNNTMMLLNPTAMSAIAICLAGCASAPKVVVQEPVGPCHVVPSGAIEEGALQVYSARVKADVDPNTEEWLWNNDFGKNEFLYATAHSGFTIFGEGGKVLQHVSNARSIHDEKPALVRLHPGYYTVKAEAEQLGGAIMTVLVPVVVKAGQTTSVHLEPNWRPSGELPEPSRLVMLSDGRIIGCGSEHPPGQHLPSTARAEAAEDRPGTR